jgi:copper chaperone NosL
MKKRVCILALAAAVFFVLSVMVFAQVMEDIQLHKECKLCGMDRGKFDFSRMLIEYDDGTIAAVCSIHCAAAELAGNLDKTPRSLMVGDLNSKALIDAEKAFWVVGGRKQGVMSKRGKWAFEKKDAAEDFIKTNEGKLFSFEEAMNMAYEDMYQDTKMIREKRKQKRMEMMKTKQVTP